MLDIAIKLNSESASMKQKRKSLTMKNSPRKHRLAPSDLNLPLQERIDNTKKIYNLRLCNSDFKKNITFISNQFEFRKKQQR